MFSKLSVIVPIYGVEAYLEECIQSIVNQSYKNIEIILVDDGSKDRCPEICDNWKQKDNRIIVIHKENGGLVSARQEGIRKATGDYIGYVDGDDWIEPQFYEKIMNVVEKRHSDIVVAGFKKHLNNKEFSYTNIIKNGTYSREQIEKYIIPKMMSCGEFFQCGIYTYVWNKVFKRELIYNIQCAVDTRLTIGEDAACTYLAILQANMLSIIQEDGYHYRQRVGSILRGKQGNALIVDKIQYYYKYMNEKFKNSEFYLLLKKQLQEVVVSHLIMMSDSTTLKYPLIKRDFPMGRLENCQIILYSTGAFGIHLFQQLEDEKHIQIVAWTDPDYEEYVNISDKICALDSALEFSYDYIVIASVDYQYVQETKALLKKKGISDKYVVDIQKYIQEDIYMLKQMGCFIED